VADFTLISVSVFELTSTLPMVHFANLQMSD
jgi:hypothetical protein